MNEEPEAACMAMGENPNYGKTALDALKATVKAEKRRECVDHLCGAEASLTHYENSIEAEILKHKIAALKLGAIAFFQELKHQ